MKAITRLTLLVCLLAAAVCFAAVSPDKPQPGEELARSSETTGHYGGHLTIGRTRRTEDAESRDGHGRGVARGDSAD